MKGYGLYAGCLGILCAIAWGNAVAQRAEIDEATATLTRLHNQAVEQLAQQYETLLLPLEEHMAQQTTRQDAIAQRLDDVEAAQRVAPEHHPGRWRWLRSRSPAIDSSVR